MKLDDALKSNQLKDIEQLYMKEFPKKERKPFPLICDKARNGEMEILAVNSVEGEFCGLVITIVGSKWILLDYFAIETKKQGNNIGSEVLHLLNRRYKDKGIVLEIERTDVECSNKSQRLRRKQFYLKNGMKEMGIYVELFGVEMELLTNGNQICFDEYQQIYRTIFGEKITDKIRIVL